MNHWPSASHAWRALARLASAVAACATGLQSGALAAAQTAACFQAADRPSPNIEIYQQAPAPPVGKSRFSPYYPATAFATQNLDSLWNAESGLDKYYFQWANRAALGIRNASGQAIARKSNFQPGSTGPLGQRTAFTTIDKANACTLAQTATVLGLDASTVARIATSGGVNVVHLDDGARGGVANATDICVVQNRAMPSDSAGIVLDYEVQDGRTATQTLQFLAEFADLVHKANRKAVLLTNPLDAPTQTYTNITPQNASQLANLFDRMTLLIWSRNAEGDVQASFDKQFQIVNWGGSVDPRRLIVAFELANTGVGDARTIREMMLRHGLGGVMFWRDGAKQGGDCNSPVNQKIACLALGRCEGKPAADEGRNAATH